MELSLLLREKKDALLKLTITLKHQNQICLGMADENVSVGPFPFLDGFSHLYKRMCLSVGWSDGRFVGWSVGPSVRHSEFLRNPIFRPKWNKIALRT